MPSFAEIQIDDTTFLAIIQTLASLAPNQFPTLPFLPDKQLIRSLHLGGNSIYGPIAGVAQPPGSLVLTLPITINHVSIDELAADAAAPGTNVSATMIAIVTLSATTLSISVVRIDVGNAHHPLASPASFGAQSIPIALPGGLAIVGAALLHDPAQKLVVARLAVSQTAAQLMTTFAITDRRAGNNWAIFVDKGLLTSGTKHLLDDQLGSDLPADIQIEDPATVTWTFAGSWGMDVSVGLLAIDACPAIIGDDVDMSVELIARLELLPDIATQRLQLKLHASHDASDWDTFRCVLQNIAGGLIAFATIPAFWALSAAVGILGTLIAPFALPPLIDSQTGDAIGGQDLDGFDKIDPPEGDDDATFTQSQPLPTLLGALPSSAVTTAEGLVVTGLVPIVFPGQHEQTVKPKPVPGSWEGGYSCSKQSWHLDYKCQKVTVTDVVKALGTTVTKPSVRVFSTTEVRPAASWMRELSTGSSIDVTAIGDVPAGTTGTLFVHSSAGLSRVELKPTTAKPPQPSAIDLVKMKADCMKAGSKWHGPGNFDLHWLVDPPPYELVADVMRQWLIQFAAIPAGGAVEIATVGAGAAQHLRVDAGSARRNLSLVTPGSQTLRLSVTGAQPVSATVSQRLLLPLSIAEVGAPITAMARTGAGSLAIVAGPNLAVVGFDGTVRARRASKGAVGVIAAPDGDGAIAYGPAGAVRIAGVGPALIASEPVHAIERSHGALVLHGARGQATLRGARLERAAEVNIRRVAAPSAPPTLELPGGRLAVAVGSRLVIAQPWGARHDVNAG